MSGSTDELAAFQDALARLSPAPDEINLARLLFRAGQRSAQRRSWAWPCAAAASMMLAVSLASVLLFRPVPQPAERIVRVIVPPPVNSADEPPRSAGVPPAEVAGATPALRNASEGDYLQLRRAVLAKGLDALPPPEPWPAVAPADEAGILRNLPRGGRELWFLRLKRSFKLGDAS